MRAPTLVARVVVQPPFDHCLWLTGQSSPVISGVAQRTSITSSLVRNAGGLAHIGAFERHRQSGVTERQALRIEATGSSAATHGERDRRKAIFGVAVEVFVDVKRVVGSVESGEVRAETKTAFYRGHQREKVGDIRNIEGLGQFCEDKLAPVGHLGGDDARSVAPVVFGDGDGWGGQWIVVRCGWRFRCLGTLVALAFATERHNRDLPVGGLWQSGLSHNLWDCSHAPRRGYA